MIPTHPLNQHRYHSSSKSMNIFKKRSTITIFTFLTVTNFILHLYTYLELSANENGVSINKKKIQRRKFVSYQSSKWEQMWLDNIGKLEQNFGICEHLIANETDYIHDFLTASCTSRFPTPYDEWCVIDDTYLPLYYNLSSNRKIPFDATMIKFIRPPEIPKQVERSLDKAVIPSSKYSHIFSQFTFLDELTNETFVEYIEPLVSHLRFPLAVCVRPPCPRRKRACDVSSIEANKFSFIFFIFEKLLILFMIKI